MSERPHRDLGFISPELIQEPVVEGGMTEVVGVNHVPRELRKEGEGCMIKVYTYPLAQRLAENGSFGSAEDAREYLERLMFDIPDDRKPEDISLMDRAKMLKDRQDALVDFFKPELPSVIQQSLFLVAADEGDQQRIFELQREVDGYYLPAFKAIKNIVHLPEEARLVLKQELELFAEKVQRLIEGVDDPSVPLVDLKLGNVGVDREGHIRVVDTNIALPVKNQRLREKMLPSIAGALQTLRSDIREILELLSVTGMRQWMMV